MPLTPLENLEEEARGQGIVIDENALRAEDPLDGLCMQDDASEATLVLLNRHRPACARHVALAEELGHHHRSVGNIVNQSDVAHRKSETAGRAWAYERLAPAEAIRGYLRKGYFSFQEIAEALDVTTDFLLEAMAYYQRKGVVLNTEKASDTDALEVPAGFTLIPRSNQKLTDTRKKRFYSVLNRSVDRVLAQEKEQDIGRIHLHKE